MRLACRWLVMCGLLGGVGAGLAQEDIAPVSLSVVVTEQSLGPELVEVTALRPDYPSELLRAQVAELGRLVGTPPRGLYVAAVPIVGREPAQKFLKARFAVDRLIQRERGVLWLQPIVQAFASAPGPFMHRTIKIQFAGERPTDGTLTAYKSDAVALVGTPIQEPQSVEYLVALRTQDPAKLTIPERHTPAPRAPAPAAVPPATPWPVVAALIGAAALAAGCLVYFGALAWGRRGLGPSRRPDR